MLYETNPAKIFVVVVRPGQQHPFILGHLPFLLLRSRQQLQWAMWGVIC